MLCPGGVRDVVAVCAIAMCWRLGKLVGVRRLTLLVCSCAIHFRSMRLAMHQGYARVGPATMEKACSKHFFHAAPSPIVKTYTTIVSSILTSILTNYAHARRSPHCLAITAPAKPALLADPLPRFIVAANQTARCTTSTPSMRCSRRTDTDSRFACCSRLRLTTRGLHAMRAQTSRRGSRMFTRRQR